MLWVPGRELTILSEYRVKKLRVNFYGEQRSNKRYEREPTRISNWPAYAAAKKPN